MTPHIGTQGKTRFLSNEEKDARRAPAPVYNYDIESELVLGRLRLLDDQKKMEVEWFDDKLIPVHKSRGASAFAEVRVHPTYRLIYAG